MKNKSKNILNALLIVSLLCITPASKASATSLMSIISRAAQSMSTAQIEVQHIADRINWKTQIIQKKNNKPALEGFVVYSYIEHGTVHNAPSEIVHRSNLPLTILTYQKGYANISGVTIDGVALTSGLVRKIPFDGEDIDEYCMQAIFLNESDIENLSDGYHLVYVNCVDSQGATSSSYFDFYLID